MIILTWQPLSPFPRAPGPVTEPWLVACENMPAAAKYLRLKTTGKWTPMSGLPECGPDGLVGQTFPTDRLLIPDCAVGALLGGQVGEGPVGRGRDTLHDFQLGERRGRSLGGGLDFLRAGPIAP